MIIKACQLALRRPADSIADVFHPLILVALLSLLLPYPARSDTNAVETIHFGVLSIAPPARILAKWQPFADYLGEKLGKPVKIVVPRGFGRMKKAVANRQVEFFYINSHVFYRLKQAGHAIGVAQMQNIDGKKTSRSEIFVRGDSGISSISGLKGKQIAFISPMGAGGYLAPRAYLRSHGVKSGDEVDETFTKNLSTSIHKVLLNETGAASMCGVNFRLMGEKVDTGELKIIAVSDEYPENLIAARADLDPKLVERFRNIVVNMQDDPEGFGVLTGMTTMKIKRFLPYDPAMEDLTRKLLEQAGLKP
ncbi:phosphate/phosphite/phosphonate ABC transporter binding protein [Thiogranum longum]|uniref:Phosphate/phosphite/phosphonate ABC transporter binding protein n=1 Tax=Thiogranum longum TaxID=1537524 RepID=A0A4R1HF01_9GAMM|nr:phosphate/phosphite/phosphonate ABC transporter substrate-binding protein [Thiogranum longum]TCK18780.1 phosphate/phosphite/phosphonate ABC transporter binding protein [Thiogranum longum]